MYIHFLSFECYIFVLHNMTSFCKRIFLNNFMEFVLFMLCQHGLKCRLLRLLRYACIEINYKKN